MGCCLVFVGGVSGGVTPGPIPNPEAKSTSADGTALGRVWESRSPPTFAWRIEYSVVFVCGVCRTPWGVAAPHTFLCVRPHPKNGWAYPYIVNNPVWLDAG